MQLEESGTELPPAFAAANAWQTTLFLGVVTLILGLIVSFHPTGSLNVISVLLGVLMIISGIFHLIRVFGSAESRRVWLGISGLLLIVIGVVLIRHLHLTVAIIGLIIGISWIVQGLSALAAGLSGGSREGSGWWIFFGVVSVIGGIVITAVPVASVTALAVLIGIWFIIEGLFELIAGFMLRHAINKSQAIMVNPPPRAGEGASAL
ncbi:MAG TPA: HdeD family acid-resistance protein [Streptosporangiaceae bacterium]|nr:HdeD family acid-resistance protein [Streptosporangiaceae bacterium]